MKHRCPVCKSVVRVSPQGQAGEAKFFPFCSQRCKLVDLGEWLDARYKITSRLQAQESGEPSNTFSDSPLDKQ